MHSWWRHRALRSRSRSRCWRWSWSWCRCRCWCRCCRGLRREALQTLHQQRRRHGRDSGAPLALCCCSTGCSPPAPAPAWARVPLPDRHRRRPHLAARLLRKFARVSRKHSAVHPHVRGIRTSRRWWRVVLAHQERLAFRQRPLREPSAGLEHLHTRAKSKRSRLKNHCAALRGPWQCWCRAAPRSSPQRPASRSRHPPRSHPAPSPPPPLCSQIARSLSPSPSPSRGQCLLGCLSSSL